jgi:hypothetical protein
MFCCIFQAFDSHRAAVLTLTLSEDGTRAWSSGIDPAVVEFNFIAPHHKSHSLMWVMSGKETKHTHDVRAMIKIGDWGFSGGASFSHFL